MNYFYILIYPRLPTRMRAKKKEKKKKRKRENFPRADLVSSLYVMDVYRFYIYYIFVKMY